MSNDLQNILVLLLWVLGTYGVAALLDLMFFSKFERSGTNDQDTNHQ